MINSLLNPSERAVTNESLTIVSDNTLPDLANTPIDGSVTLFVRGKEEDSASGGAFSQSGASLTWSEANAGYSIDSTDRVIATYNIY